MKLRLTTLFTICVVATIIVVANASVIPVFGDPLSPPGNRWGDLVDVSGIPQPDIDDQVHTALPCNMNNTTKRPTHVPDQLIVKLRQPLSLSANALEDKHSVKLTKQLLLQDYVLVSVPAGTSLDEATRSLESDPNIESVEPNGYVYTHFTPNDPGYEFQWHLPQIQMPLAWDLTTGSEVTVAVIDTGIAYENYGAYARAPDLANTSFVPGYDFINDDTHPNDDNSHGTHVAGTIAQSTNNGIGVAGVAYGASIMPVKVLNSVGEGTEANVADGITWATDHGANVINLSLGNDTGAPALESAIDYAYSRGVTVIASSGNENAWSVSYPAAYPHVIAVGATRYDQARAPYSNYGSALDLVAPGGDMSVDQNGDGYLDGVLQQTFIPPDLTTFGYYFANGTSMAAPHVSGVAAMLISAGVATTPDEVCQALQSTAKDLGAPGWDPYFGWGLIQAYDALASTTASPSISSFAPVSGGVGTNVTVSGDNFTGATAVRFNGLSASFNVLSDTIISATVPAGASTGPISVTTPGGTGTSAASFTVGQAQVTHKVYVPLVMKNHSPAPPTPTWTTIKSENFEGTFPGQWQVVDNDGATNGDYRWGKRTCNVYGGSYSGWAVGWGASGSALSCGSNYPNNARSWMVYGPFSLAEATSAEMRFKLWLNCESEYDTLGALASVNGENFYGSATWGNSNGWVDMAFDLTDVHSLGNLAGQQNVWVALVFDSDNSVNFPQGANVDDIVIRKCSGSGCASSAGMSETPSAASDSQLTDRSVMMTLGQ